jgi:hypothetical protein
LRLRIIVKSQIGKSPGTVWIPAELIQAGGKILHSEIYEFINFIWNKEKLP